MIKKSFFKKTALGFLSLAILSFIVFWVTIQKDTPFSKGQTEITIPISIGHKQLKALLADTPAKQEKGLGGRDGLSNDEAMLFLFDIPAPYGFWMKDMRFTIDIFWLDVSKKIIFIKEQVLPASYPEIFTPTAPAKYVLETNSGFAKENSIKIGDTVSF